jgi:hypothetical protein
MTDPDDFAATPRDLLKLKRAERISLRRLERILTSDGALPPPAPAPAADPDPPPDAEVGSSRPIGRKR